LTENKVTCLQPSHHSPLQAPLCENAGQFDGAIYWDDRYTLTALWRIAPAPKGDLKAETFSALIALFLSKYPAFDSMFSVIRLQTRLWDSLTRPINHNPAILLQTQDLPPVYEENSCFYLFTRQNLLARRNRLGERPLMIEIPRLEAVDIDEEADFEIADLLMRRRLGLA
jgi:hypothetical protein